jgi:hypothetical protein
MNWEDDTQDLPLTERVDREMMSCLGDGRYVRFGKDKEGVFQQYCVYFTPNMVGCEQECPYQQDEIEILRGNPDNPLFQLKVRFYGCMRK